MNSNSHSQRGKMTIAEMHNTNVNNSQPFDTNVRTHRMYFKTEKMHFATKRSVNHVNHVWHSGRCTIQIIKLEIWLHLSIRSYIFTCNAISVRLVSYYSSCWFDWDCELSGFFFSLSIIYCNEFLQWWWQKEGTQEYVMCWPFCVLTM